MSIYPDGKIGSPLDIRDVKVWLDARDTGHITESSGGTITSWLSKAGGHVVKQRDTTDMPSYSSTAFSNRGGITFDTSDYLQTIDTVGTEFFSATETTMMIVYNQTGGDVLFRWQSGDPNRVNFETGSSGEVQFEFDDSTTGKITGVTDISNTSTVVTAVKNATTCFQ